MLLCVCVYVFARVRVFVCVDLRTLRTPGLTVPLFCTSLVRTRYDRRIHALAAAFRLRFLGQRSPKYLQALQCISRIYSIIVHGSVTMEVNSHLNVASCLLHTLAHCYRATGLYITHTYHKLHGNAQRSPTQGDTTTTEHPNNLQRNASVQVPYIQVGAPILHEQNHRDKTKTKNGRHSTVVVLIVIQRKKHIPALP